MSIASLLAEHLLGRRDPIPLVGEHAGGRSTGIRRRGLEQLRQQAGIDSMKTLLQPEHFHPQPVGMGIGANGREPLPCRGEHLVAGPGLQVGPHSVAGPPLGRLELLKHRRDRLPGLGLGGNERAILADEPIDPAKNVVAVGVALAVLHMADQRVGPVAKPERPVGTNLRIDRPEVLVGALDQIEWRVLIGGIMSHPRANVARAVVGDRPSRHAVGVDDTGIGELVLHVVGKLPRAEVFAPHDRPHPLGVKHRVQALAAAVLLSREGRVPVLIRAGAVAADALAPLVEDIAPGVSVAGGDEVTELPCPRIEHVGARGAEVAERAPRRLHGGAHRDALEHIEETARAGLEGTHGVVRVLGGPAVEHVHHLIGLVIAVGVLQPEHPRLIDHEHAAGEELEAGRAVKRVAEDGALIGHAVGVGILQNHELVSRLGVARLPLRIAGHRRDPEPALGIKRQLHGVGDLREAALVGKEFDLEAGRHGAVGDQVGRRLDDRTTLGIFAVRLLRVTKPCLRQEQVARARVVGNRRHRLSGGDIPDVLVADGGHVPQLCILAGEGFRVPGAAAAVDIPAVDHSVVLHVHPRLVVDRRAQPREIFSVEPPRWRSTEKKTVELFSHKLIAGLVHVAAIDRELQAWLRRKRLLCRRQEIDEGEPPCGGHLPCGG